MSVMALFACLPCRGISYDKLGHYELAIQDFDRVIQLEPSNSVAYFNRGSTYDSMGAHDAAISDFGRALELDPVNVGLGHAK